MARSDDREFTFDVNPRVVLALGRDLITDEFQAVVELIKNSYDAGSPFVNVEVSTAGSPESVLPKSLFPDASGYVAISDAGSGMDLNTLRSAWMVVADSPKRRDKLSGKRSKKGRVPLGDKGLGRLGAQLLGRNLELVTASGGVSHHVGFEWQAFETARRLRDIPVIVGHATNRRGTRLVLSGLVSPERWTGRDAHARIATRLAELISPFESIDGFVVNVTIDGAEVDLLSIGRKLRREADVAYRLTFDGERLESTGRVKLRFLRPGGGRRVVFEERVEKRDGGDALLRYLANSDPGARLRRARGKGWYLEFTRSFQVSDLDHLSLDADGAIAGCGPFSGELDSFSLSREAKETQQVFSTGAEYSAYVKDFWGVRVYRNGFGVRTDRDFLNLGDAETRGRSWYTLRPANTMGFISLSAAENAQLQEKTDREGFKETPAFRNFRRILDRFKDHTAIDLSFLRRTAIQFCDELHAREAGVDGSTPEQLAKTIANSVKQAKKQRTVIAGLTKQLGKTRNDVKKRTTTPADTKRVAKELDGLLAQVERALGAAEQSLSALEALGEQSEVLERKLGIANEQLSRAYETMSLGLTAEALSHELDHIVASLAQRAADLEKATRSAAPDKPTIDAFLRSIKSALRAFRRQLAHLDSSLKYARDAKLRFNLERFISQLADYHESRWAGMKLRIKVVNLSDEPFEVMASRGRLTQVFDNLILNSEYWLKEGIRLGQLSGGEIKIELQAPSVWVSDNGPGIDKAVESTLFQPFVSTKAEGRGLGLFVTRELLAADGCDIGVYSERNEQGRLYAFHLDFAGVWESE